MSWTMFAPILRRWGPLAAVAGITALLPHLYPHSRPLNLLFRGRGFLVTWGIILGLALVSKLVRRYVQARYPESPPVPRHDFPAMVLAAVLFIAMIFIDEYYRLNPIPDIFPLRAYLFFFGSRRYFLTWPIVALLIFKWNRHRQHKKQHRRGNP